MANYKRKIETERLILKNWNLENIEDAVRLFQDKELIFGQAPFPYETHHAKYWIENMPKDKEVINIAIEEKEFGKIIGMTFISQINQEKNDCLIGYGFEEEARGKGYATETNKAIIKFIQEELKITKVRAETSGVNFGSHKVLKKTEFKIINKIKNDHPNRFTKEMEDKWFWVLEK